MAATTELRERALTRLEGLELTLGDLSEVAEEWESLADGERVSWSVDWSNEMSGLKRLAQDVSNNLLTEDEQARYRRLLFELEQALPVIERLELYRPPIPKM